MSETPLWMRWAKVNLVGAAIVGFGVLCFKYTTPSDEQLISRMSPEVRSQYEREKSLRRKEQEELIRIVKQTSASNDPIWMTGPIKSPLEHRAFQLKDKEKRERDVAAEEQQKELADIKKQIDEAQQTARLENEKAMASSGKGWLGWGK
ncbi:Cbp4 protein [Saccharomycopsis crataegensis]|uniref:Cytochrome b mRNA-processing protein 4 n=1 Tax=Saccharomycopsis crataegensis TaxID=43959 RepID=A0AAV5QPB6_9ASCO|nr:Cbp4 protein [Saccharomycopsis crataegensis]